ncbi:MAG: hypothetical protein Q8N18_26230 [Opitutaceae bacterium]|nr:hypothetical protein [Opitutaceae bacterium]
MARLILPPLSAEAASYFESIIGKASGEFDPEELNSEQVEHLLVVLDGEMEQLRDEATKRTLSSGESEKMSRPIADLASALTRVLVRRQG